MSKNLDGTFDLESHKNFFEKKPKSLDVRLLAF